MSEKKDSLISILESENCLGTILVVYEKAGEGPEGILSHVFADELHGVTNVPAKLRALADYWEKEKDQPNA